MAVIIQVVTFNLNGLSDEEYRSACDALAPELARVPGLMLKVWLADEASNTYGGVYTWVDEQAMDAFARSEFFKAFAVNPGFANITSRTFGILQGPSQVTRASIAIAA
jgi:quinol monooxygenase YgiN